MEAGPRPRRPNHPAATGYFGIQRQQDLGVAPRQTRRGTEILFGPEVVLLLTGDDARHLPALQIAGTVGGGSVRTFSGHGQHRCGVGSAFGKGKDSAHGVIFPEGGFSWK